MMTKKEATIEAIHLKLWGHFGTYAAGGEVREVANDIVEILEGLEVIAFNDHYEVVEVLRD